MPVGSGQWVGIFGDAHTTVVSFGLAILREKLTDEQRRRAEELEHEMERREPEKRQLREKADRRK